jgi:hypothetical protein
MEYLDQYTPEERRRHEMRPGITGWAVVNGRHTARFKERLRLDVWYIDHWSLGLDLRILARTLYQVIRREDVSTTQDIAEIGFPLPVPPPAGSPAYRRERMPGADGASARAPVDGGRPGGACTRSREP